MREDPLSIDVNYGVKGICRFKYDLRGQCGLVVLIRVFLSIALKYQYDSFFATSVDDVRRSVL